ncbi:MAG TPA: hypothetical protein VFT91_11810, partial [Dehalococcoidia bacterium]|nr:hypothetical protein [Dehalococcoidia bacterium]
GSLCDNIFAMRRTLAAYAGLLALLTALAAAGGVYVYHETGSSDPIESAADAHAYSVPRWEFRYLAGKWLYKLGHLFDGHHAAADDLALRRYFALSDEIERLSRDPAAAGSLEAARRQRRELENRVENILEGRITALLRDQGLVMDLPLFSDIDPVFPPVDLELDSPPRVLAVSPRDRIELQRSYLLAPGLDLAAVTSIERKAEGSSVDPPAGVSALVIPTAGVATYPSVVSSEASYEDLVEDAIHEWTHQYLAFYPLGSSYFASDETRTLNETVASIAGRELARLFFQRYPPPVTPTSAPPAPSDFDFTAEMRALRRQVEELLAAGRITDAEALMARKRDEFEAKGIYIRRLNQAYFAFHGSYAVSPGSIDPIGPKLQALLERAGSPGAFVRLARGLTSRADLDRLLAQG